MALEKGGEEDTSTGPSSSHLVFYAAICMVGRPVEVKVKDGSLYSGIFHTASFKKDCGIVLKKARKIRQGKCFTNLALGDFVETLVVLLSDLVQVALEDGLLLAEGIVDNAGINAEMESEIEPDTCNVNLEKGGKGKGKTCGDISASREVTGFKQKGEKDDDPVEEVHEVHHLTSSTNTGGAGCSSRAHIPIKLVSPDGKGPTSEIFPLTDARTSPCTAFTTLTSDITATSSSSISASTDSSTPKKNIAQESTLNPMAKVFTPSMTNLRPLSTAMTSIGSPSQMSNNISLIPVGGAQLGTECLRPFPSIAAHTGSTQPILGHASGGQLPVGVNGQYHPLQAGCLYSNPHSQLVVSGQLNQPAYVHPVSQGANQRTHLIPQGQPHGMLSHINAPNFQVQNTQLPMTQVFMAGGHQALVVPSHGPFSQPFPVIQPMMVPGGGNNYPFH
ncbi:hypothetical protein Cni_G12130 [Canna indica]|uniref:Ataxin 2 SM domain-containing protein n=1 Tax=Canna indica TaxID=4628 RepID=A0AAQ3K971_9LILI|nr:hypothetical protein Cni_G12130 [Canna indica]